MLVDRLGAPIVNEPGVQVPGTFLTVVNYDTVDPLYRCLCGTELTLSRRQVERATRRCCGAGCPYYNHRRREIDNPVGKAVSGSFLVPVDYTTKPPTYLCILCETESQHLRWQVDHLIIKSCGCARRPRDYFAAKCTSCGATKVWRDKAPPSTNCHACGYFYHVLASPAAAKDYHEYLRSRQHVPVLVHPSEE